jgi:diguanylate cyclase (GGDEF)-like protein
MDRLFRTGGAGGVHGAGVMPRPRAPSRGEAVVILDVDQFAQIRARHGVHAGEAVTRAVAECLRRDLRTDDRLALLRDEEFLVVLAGTCEACLPGIERRLREGVQALRLALAGAVWTLSCTTGGAARGEASRSLEGLVRAADGALHLAKRAPGRCVSGGRWPG